MLTTWPLCATDEGALFVQHKEQVCTSKKNIWSRPHAQSSVWDECAHELNIGVASPLRQESILEQIGMYADDVKEQERGERV